MKAMKKLVGLVLSAAVLAISAVPAFAAADPMLSETTKVNVENTDTCFAKVTDTEYHTDSNYYMHFKTSGDWLEVSQNLTETITAGGQYLMTVVAKPVTGTVWFRLGWDDTGWLSSGQLDLATDLGDGWLKYEKIVTMTDDQTNFLFHNDGAAEFYVDSISLVPVGGGAELLQNAGFDVVNYDAATDIITAKDTTVNVANTEAVFAKMLWEAGEADNTYSLHFKAGASDWLEVTQDLTEGITAGGQYVITAYAKPVTGKVWFRLGWDDTGWMATHSADVIEVQPDGWTKYQKTVTLTADQTNLLFHNDGEAEFYIDDISVVKVGETENLMPDGGFGEVLVENEGIDDEKLVLSDTTKVNVENTKNCFAKPTEKEYHADSNYYMHFKTNNNGDWLEAAQSLKENTTAGSQYVLTAVVKHVAGQLWVRVGWDGDASNAWMAIDGSSEGVDMGNGWKKYEKTITMLGNQNTLIMHNAGVTECYIDSVSLVPVGGGADLMMDSEFDEVSYNAETGVVTSTSMNLPAGATMQYEAKEAENTYSLHFKAGAEDCLEVSQDFAEPLSAGQYVLTAYAKPVTGKVWFYVNWDASGWMATHAADIIEVQPDGWTKYQKTITIDGVDDTKLLFHNDGAAEFYIDDISLVKVGSTQELMPDGGFGEVTIPGQEPEEPDVPDEPTVKYEISNPVFNGLTEEGKLQEGTVEVSVAVRNLAMGNNFEPIMVVALYNGTRLCDVSSLQKGVTQYADELIPADDFVLTIDVPELTETSDYKLRIMYWDGLDALEPLGEIDTLN